MSNNITFYTTLVEMIGRTAPQAPEKGVQVEYVKEIGPYSVKAYVSAEFYDVHLITVAVNNYIVLQYSSTNGRGGYTSWDISNSKNIKRLILNIFKERLGEDWIVLALLLDDYIDPEERIKKSKTGSASSYGSNHDMSRDDFGDNLVDAAIVSAMFID